MNAVVFDMDGVMFDTEAVSVMAWDYAGEKLGLGKCGYLTIPMLGTNMPLKEEIIRKEFGGRYRWEDFGVYLREFRKRYYQTHDLPVKKGLYDLLDYLKGRGMKLAVASGTSQRGVEDNLRKAKVRDYFHAVIGGDMVETSKPAPDIYLKACELLGEKPEDCIAIEDSPNGLRSAHGAGCRVYMVPDLWQPDDWAKEAAAGIFADLDELREYLGASDGKQESFPQ